LLPGGIKVDELVKMSLIEHLQELRYRLLIVLAFVFGLSLICFLVADWLRNIILQPAGEISLIYLTPPEAFLGNLRLAFSTGLLLSLPAILYQVLAFILPGFYQEEKRVLLPSFLAIAFLSFLGLAFSYYVVFPLAINFFLGFAGERLLPMFSFRDYLSFFIRFHLAFSLVFQLPLIMLIVGFLGLVSYHTLAGIRKFALLGIIIIAAIITPPDFFSQVLMIVPLYLLYELGLILVGWLEKRRKK